MTKTSRLFSQWAFALAVPAVVGLLATRCGPPPPTNTCKGRVPGDLVITEIMNNPTGTDTGFEYVEIYNASGAAVELKGVAIFSADQTGGSERVHLFASGTIEPASYYVVGDVRDANLPAYVNYSYADGIGALRNEAGTVGLRCGSVELDKVVYVIDSTPPGPTGTAGHALILDGDVTPPNSASNDDLARWCDAKTEYATASGIYGSPGQPNESCATGPVGTEGMCKDVDSTDRMIVKPTEGQLVISEFLADPTKVTDTNGEFIEVYATADVDLNGLEILREGSASGPWALTPTAATSSPPPCMRVPAGTYAVIARNKDPLTNGKLPAAKVIATASLSLLQSPSSPATSVGLILRSGTTEIDRTSYTSAQAVAGKSAQFAGTPDAALNETTDAYCISATTWNDNGTPGDASDDADLGTPGAADDCA